MTLWLALFAGFSPVIVQFARHEAWFAPTSTLVAPVLVAVSLWRGRVPHEPPRRSGAAWIAAGLALELVGIALDTWTIAWLGFPVAVIGMALWQGSPSWRIAVLTLGLVAVPESVRAAATPVPETALLSGACAAWRAIGVPFACTGPVARLGELHLELQSDDVGWTLAPLLAQLGWFAAVNAGRDTARAVRSALAFAAATLVISPLAIAVALGLVAAGSPSAARLWLTPGVWLACSAAVLLAAARRASADSLDSTT